MLKLVLFVVALQIPVSALPFFYTSVKPVQSVSCEPKPYGPAQTY